MSFRGFCAQALCVIAFTAGMSGAWAARPQVTRAVDEHDLVTLDGNTRPEANAVNDRGAVDPAMPVEHLKLLLKRAPEDEQAVEDFIERQHNPASPDFHKWLSAAEFGQRFGVAQSDIDAARAWLTRRGFRVGPVDPARMRIDFSGTAGQIATVFRTEIHHLDVDGERHLANMSDPLIPAALSPAVEGIVQLHDFRPEKRHRRASPDFTGHCDVMTCYLVTPADLAVIYDFNALFNAETPITGKGQTIAVIESTDLYSTSDWTTFRSIFGLDRFTAASLTTVHPASPPGDAACTDPGVNFNDDEAALDVEWASAAAPDAAILVAACTHHYPVDGLLQAVANLINGNSPPPIISVSYGECEAKLGPTRNANVAALFQQADAEGVSVFVATGDDGPADCSSSTARVGIGVNAWSSTAHNVAAGGTDFGDTAMGTSSTYWSSTDSPTYGSALSYIPEIAWNDTCASDLFTAAYGFTKSYGQNGFCNSPRARDNLILGGGEGGPSNCALGAPAIYGVVGGTCRGRPKPSFQKKLFGMPNDGVRDIPDVSMFAADGSWAHQYALCLSDLNNFGAPCSGDPAIWAQGGGGTSYATPIIAGIQALVNQNMGGGAQGNAAPVYYALARAEYGVAGNPNCNSSLGTGGSSTCVFHNVTMGNNAQNCIGIYNCFLPSGHFGVMSLSDSADDVAFKSHPGYNLTSGIGTIDAANLVNAWASGQAALASGDPAR